LKHNPTNERLKREYFRYLKEAKGRDEASIDAVAKALSRFETSTSRKDFGKLHREQAIAFKRRLADAANERTGERLSKSTVHATLRHCREFFLWLAREPGYQRKIQYADADYFNLSEKDVAVARARREKRVPTLAQAEHVLTSIPGNTQIERRDRALIAFTMLTAARVDALASLQLGDVDLRAELVSQDARHVRTKFRKSFTTWFMPVSDLAMEIVRDWHAELRADVRRGLKSPLFPATAIGLDELGAFKAVGLAAHGWASTGPVRAIFKRAFEQAGLPYFNPHSFRDMLVRHAMSLDLPAQELKAWSQNLGHNSVLTTLTSYGHVPAHLQGELIRASGTARQSRDMADEEIAMLEAVLQKLKAAKP
jgi:integrase